MRLYGLLLAAGLAVGCAKAPAPTGGGGGDASDTTDGTSGASDGQDGASDGEDGASDGTDGASDGTVDGTDGATDGTDGTGPVLSDNAVPDFTLADLNPSSPRFSQAVSPRDYLEQVSGWYFVHSS